jgi:hypothetical protein
MTGTSTRIVDFEKLAARGPDAAVVVKLMMTCNDMTLANLSLTDWKREQPRDRRDLQIGARLYFVRLELAHLYEGLKVIPEIRSTPSLLRHLDLCDAQTRASFAELETFAKGGAKNEELETLVGRIRHNLTFHYDASGKSVNKAITDRANRKEARLATITRGNTAHRWRFGAADDIVDSIVVREIWKVPRTADLRSAVDEVAMKVHRISLLFLDFSGEYVWRYFQS